MTSSAIGERKKQILLIKKVVITNKRAFAITNNRDDLAEIIPAGISRIMVLGFDLSISLSIYRLKAMAALLANIIHSITNKKRLQLKFILVDVTANKKPIIANGKAKIV